MGIYTGKGSLELDGPLLPVDILPSSALLNALESRQQKTPSPISCTALIDTGTTRTIIREGIAADLDLHPVGRVKARTASSSVEGDPRSIYSIQLVLPNGLTADLTQAVEMPLREPGIDVLIGRDILRHAVFVYIGTENQFTLSL
jgi:hypothetical protein